MIELSVTGALRSVPLTSTVTRTYACPGVAASQELDVCPKPTHWAVERTS